MSATAGSPPAALAMSPPADVKPSIIRRPSLIMKPAQSPPSGSPAPTSATTPMSLTSKEWVIPPRPKPGRKPATDTPPTKRKAQNRAAQRAFRERRAARVGELEEQIKQIEDENDKEQDALRDEIARLEKEIEQYRADLVSWVDRCRKLENDLAAAKSSRTPPSASRPTSSSHSRTSNHSIHEDSGDAAVGCGNCTLETRCQCIDDAFDAMNGGTGHDTPHQEKRARSPDPLHSEKRIKREPKESLEIDFTAIYASKPAPNSSRTDQVSPASVVADPCGFCSDGTPCICAEMAAEQEQAQSMAHSSRAGLSNSRSEINQLAQFTPPPSEGDVSISIPATSPPSGCAAGPGTCTQCRADPNSTLFCKSLAASRARSLDVAQSGDGCCGGKANGGGCCQSRSQTDAVPLPSRTTRSRAAAGNTTIISSSSTKPGVTLTCADAYTTLSRHPAYERAAGDIATWMPKLHASDATKAIQGRPALEIDAANVMTVLKDFDRRFGQSR